MSFLPYGESQTGMWLSSLGASTLAHGGIVALMITTSIPFLPEPIVQGEEESELFVSLEILDASIITDIEPITEDALTEVEENGLLPDDFDGEEADGLDPEEDLAVPEEVLESEELEAEELAALEPEPDLVEPEEITPETLEPEVVEPEPAEPEVVEPEVLEPEIEEPEIAEPEVLEPEPEEPVIEEPEVAEPEEVEPEVEEPEIAEPEPAEPEELNPVIAQPEVIEPEVIEEENLFVGEASPVEDDFINPLAEGGGSGTGEGGVEPIFLDEPEETAEEIIVPDLEGEEVIAAIIPQEADDGPEAITLPEEEETVETALPQVEEGEGEEIAALPDVEPETPIEEALEEDGTAEAEAVAPDDTTEAPTETDEAGIAGDVQEGESRGVPIAAPTAQQIALGQLVRQIRATPAPQCTALLPRRAGEGVGLSMIGADDVALAELTDQIAGRMGTEITRSLEVIDGRQCAALDAIRQAESYPASRLGLAIEELQLRSGDTLRARIIGAGGLYITVLVVDDNGVVQDLSRFTELSDDGVPVIDAPVARAGPSRATVQLLVALGTRAPIDISTAIGNEAQDVFALLDAATLENMVFGLASFDVQ